MKWYFAAGSRGDVDMLLDEGVRSILMSYAYCKNGLSDRLVKASQRGVNVMIDSGGFTNQWKPGTVTLEGYLEFLKEHKSAVDEYVVLDDPRQRRTTLRNLVKMRELGLKPLMVDHMWFTLIPELVKQYGTGAKMCWGGLISGFRSPMGDWAGKNAWIKISQRIGQRHEKAVAPPLSKIHLLGVGQKLRRFLPFFGTVDSFDAATWSKAPGAYGRYPLYLPPAENKPFPTFHQLDPMRLPKEFHARASSYGFNPKKYEDRVKMTIRELKKYYKAMEEFYAKHKSKGNDFLREVSLKKEVEPTFDDWPAFVQVQWAAPSEQRDTAERARRSDKVTVGEFFYQPKPTRPAFSEQRQTVEGFLALFKDNPDWLPTLVQKKYDGARHQVHRKGDTVIIFTEDGQDVTDRLPGVVDEVKTLKPSTLVVDAEFERWDGQQHLPREAMSGYLQSKDAPDDSDVVGNVFDVLYIDGEDVHRKATRDRVALLDKLGLKQSTMKVPDLGHRLNLAPSVPVESNGDLERTVRRLRELPGSEGVVAKAAVSPYPLEQVTQDTWIKFHNATLIKGIVYDRTEVKGGAGWTLHYGILPGDEKPKATVNLADGRKLVPVGDTFNTRRDIKAGEEVLVEAETVNVTETPDGVEVSAWVPRVVEGGEYTGKADTVDTLKQRAKADLVLQVKRETEDGEMRYLPTRKTVIKQADLYMEYPAEEKPLRFIIHEHWRGRSVHNDLRIGLKPGKLLIGWTLFNLIKDAVKEPVTTLKQAKAMARHMADYSKVDWSTGEWADRDKPGASKPVRTQLLSGRKAPEPWNWIEAEGVTKAPEGSGAPPVGGTRNYPGVFNIVEEGTVELGAQKPWLHEYFLHGQHNRYRVIFRQLVLKVEKRHARTRCMRCRHQAPTVDVLWAEGKGRAWFCDDCFKAWKAESDWHQVTFQHEVTGGEVPVEFGEGRPARRYVLAKRVLPPSDEQEDIEEAGWHLIRPDELEPYVLQRDTAEKGWMPPLGMSALPRSVRQQIPDTFHYWKAKTAAKAKAIRDALVAAMKAGEVEVDFEATYKTAALKRTLTDAEFVLQEQTWRGPKVVREGPSRTTWYLRLDVGRPDLIVIRFRQDPVDNKKVAAAVTSDPRKASMSDEGPISPGHPLNPTKDTPSRIKVVARGDASVLSESDDYIKVQLDGDGFKGLYELRRNQEDEWLWQPSQEGPVTKRGEEAEVSMTVHLQKVDREKRHVTGIVLEPDEVDAQNDTISEDIIEQAAHKFLARYNRMTQLGLMHRVFGNIGVELVESWITDHEFTLNGKRVKKGSWLLKVYVADERLWRKVKDGQITGFSIGGKATIL